MKNEDLVTIHDQLHSEAAYVSLHRVEQLPHPVKLTSKGLRSVKIGNLLFVVQNPNTGSEYARRAKSGEKITWGFDSFGYLYRIDDKGAVNLSEERLKATQYAKK